LDVLLDAVSQSQEDFILHLVGSIPQGLDGFLQDSRIRIHNKLNHTQIALLSERCWIGLSSFALSRKHMKQACPLKSREYWMLGLPAYGDYAESLPVQVPYYQRGTESMASILSFARDMRQHSKEQVSRTMRPHIDKISLLAKLYQALCLDVVR
jgi:hypothetical protein